MASKVRRKGRSVYAVFVPEDTGLEDIYSTPEKALARLGQYGKLPVNARTKLMGGALVYITDAEGDEGETHAVRWWVK